MNQFSSSTDEAVAVLGAGHRATCVRAADAPVVPPSTLDLVTDKVVCWQVRDVHGNDYGTFRDHGEATDFGQAVADRLGLDEVRYCRVVAPAAELVGKPFMLGDVRQCSAAEVCHG